MRFGQKTCKGREAGVTAAQGGDRTPRPPGRLQPRPERAPKRGAPSSWIPVHTHVCTHAHTCTHPGGRPHTRLPQAPPPDPAPHTPGTRAPPSTTLRPSCSPACPGRPPSASSSSEPLPGLQGQQIYTRGCKERGQHMAPGAAIALGLQLRWRCQPRREAGRQDWVMSMLCPPRCFPGRACLREVSSNQLSRKRRPC